MYLDKFKQRLWALVRAFDYLVLLAVVLLLSLWNWSVICERWRASCDVRWVGCGGQQDCETHRGRNFSYGGHVNLACDVLIGQPGLSMQICILYLRNNFPDGPTDTPLQKFCLHVSHRSQNQRRVLKY